jgi:hypothetical protein
MTRMRATLAWLCAGHALAGGFYWLLLQVPESNAWMLGVSALLVFAGLVLLGVVETTAVLGLTTVEPMGAALKTALRRWWLVIFPLVVFGCIWLITGDVQRWLTRNASQIDAWIIARTGWTRTAALHTSLAWLVAFVRYGIGTSLAVSLLAALASRGLRGLGSDWARAGVGWKRLLAVSAALLIGLWLPWQAVYWRPASLPATWVQPAFAAVKLTVLFIVANLAWAAVLRSARRVS